MSEEMKTTSPVSHESHEDTLQWSIQRFYEKSWDLVKNQPVFWLFGLASLAFTSGGINYRSFSNLSSQDKQPSTIEKKSPVKKGVEGFLMNGPAQVVQMLAQAEGQHSNVLGAKTAVKETGTMVTPTLKDPAQQAPTTDELSKIENSPWVKVLISQFSQVPALVYLLLALEMFAAMILGIFTLVVGMTWAEAGLYKAFQHYDKKQKTSITQISTEAAAYIKPAFKYNILSTLVGIGFFIAVVIVVAIVAVIAGVIGGMIGGIGVLLSVLVVIAALVGAIYYLIKMSTALFWGRLYLFLDNTGARAAFDRGWELSKAKHAKRRTFKLLFSNGIIGLIFGVVSAIPMVVLIIIPVVVLAVVKHFSIWTVPFFAGAVLVGFPIMMFINSLVRSVTVGTWYFAFPVMKDSLKQSKN